MTCSSRWSKLLPNRQLWEQVKRPTEWKKTFSVGNTQNALHQTESTSQVAAMSPNRDTLLASEEDEESAGNSNLTVWKLLTFCEDDLAKLIGATRCHVTSAETVLRQQVPRKPKWPQTNKSAMAKIQLTRHAIKESEFLKINDLFTHGTLSIRRSVTYIDLWGVVLSSS